MTQIPSSLLCIPIGVMLLGLTACNTPEHKPYTQPQTQTQMPPPSSEQQSRHERKEATQAAASRQQAAPGETVSMKAGHPPSRQDQPKHAAPSASADVEITDIPVDEDGDPIIEQSAASGDRQQPQRGDSTSQTTGSGGGGRGSPTPRYGQRHDGGGGATGGAPEIDGADTAPIINIGAQTDAERLAALDRDLDGKLAKFDELMRRATEEAEQERAAGGGASMGGGQYAGAKDGGGARENPPPDGRGAGGQADTSSGLGHTPDRTGSNRAGEFKYANTGPIPTDIPDARDDDIVARQLREAATRETDPVLREKLWDEYRKYKKGINR